MKISYLIYVVTDSFYHKDATVANESADTIQICGMQNSLGDNIYFESDAYHLDKWCVENGLDLNIIKMDADV